MLYETETGARDARILAVAGKGGVGKTSLAAVIVKLLAKAYPGKRILAIDADPAVGLSTALGIEVALTVDDIRKEVVATVEDGDAKSAVELLGEARYRIFDAIVEAEGFAFIAIGRPEAEGCYCKINSYLKEVIRVLAGNFDYVVIDGEAGIEQVNRRVMEKVTHLLLVTDASRKGVQVVRSIRKVAEELVMYEKLGAVANRLPDLSARELLDTGDIPLLAAIRDDRGLAAYDLEGRNVFHLPDDSEIVRGAREALLNMGILKG
ncbi:MAG: AAA family ATPase [Spirochaetaceae bacterium]|nr:AAA family ATPase [Spirochaetaceae bacterium]